jgi:hypothetical protein
MGEEAKAEHAFSFLDELSERFIKSYTYKDIEIAYSYQFKDFSHTIKNLLFFYNNNPGYSKDEQLIKELLQTKDILIESVDKLIDRKNKVVIVAQKSKNLSDFSNDLAFKSIRVKQKEKSKTLYYVGFTIIGILVIIF